MKIRDDHMYHGAALIQIAEHPEFTAINSLKLKNKALPDSYLINDSIGVDLKYASKSVGPYREYVFNFHQPELKQLEAISNVVGDLFLALVCVRIREICCISYEQLKVLIAARRTAKGSKEDQYVLLVTAPKGKSLRAYMNAPGVKNTMLGKALIVTRNSFPSVIFG